MGRLKSHEGQLPNPPIDVVFVVVGLLTAKGRIVGDQPYNGVNTPSIKWSVVNNWEKLGNGYSAEM